MKYFDHDTDACKDERIQALRLECGGAAVDAYWTVLECVYRDETDLVLGENQPGTKAVTHWLCIGWDELLTFVNAMRDVGLVTVVENSDGTITVHSSRAQENIDSYRKKCETARENGKKGGRKPKANRKKTNSVNSANQSLTQPKTKEKEKEKLLDTHKGYPNNCEKGAKETPRCPVCGSGCIGTSSHKGDRCLFLCPECNEEVWE